MKYSLKLLLILVYISFNKISCRKSDEKCEEYAKAVYVTQESPVLRRKSKTDTVSECGIVSVPLVVGGVKATKKEFPHMAHVGFGKNDDVVYECGGTLISETFILTAGHCLNSREKGDATHVKLGVIQVKDNDPEEEQIKKVKRRIPHPDYQKPSKYNDIGLIEMDGPVEFTPYVRPACLNTKETIDEEKAIATGFGKLEYGATTGSDYLMKVVLDILKLTECKKVYEKQKVSFQKGLDPTQLCAGTLDGGKDTCQGDSGGPLQVTLKEPYCMYNIIGVTSTGLFCGYANTPAVYTTVAKYVDWIEGIVWSV